MTLSRPWSKILPHLCRFNAKQHALRQIKKDRACLDRVGGLESGRNNYGDDKSLSEPEERGMKLKEG